MGDALKNSVSSSKVIVRGLTEGQTSQVWDEEGLTAV